MTSEKFRRHPCRPIWKRSEVIEQAPLTFAQETQQSLLMRWPELRSARHATYRLVGPLDVPRLVREFQGIVRRNEALRVVIDEADGVRRQVARPVVEEGFPLSVQQINCRSEEQFTRYVTKVLKEDLVAPFDIAKQYPFRCRVFRFSEECHALTISVEHSAIDYRGMHLLTTQLWERYADGAGPSEPSMGFLQAARQQRDRCGERTAEAAKRHWRNKIAALPQSCVFATSQESGGERHPDRLLRFQLTGAELGRVEEACRRLNLSVYQVALTAFADTLLRLTDEDTVAVYIPVDSRDQGEQAVIGMFTLYLPLLIERSRFDPDRPGSWIFREMVTALAHRHVDFQALLHEAGIEETDRPADRHRCVVANYLDHGANDRAPSHFDERAGLRRDRGHYDHPGRRGIDMELAVHRYADMVELELLFSGLHFSGEHAERAMRQFTREFERQLGDGGTV
ncbi:condensation domain-containing protein [Streptomyces sp. NBC_01431]|uniref:condensation domain-containing protein n=1 Tax=Streptomyces sp. NBC_01431 TaxID=2903863 RepID=UPI002E345F63|nr:condensation domain-containing protein [Streptomyces sp. NBC_01431]